MCSDNRLVNVAGTPIAVSKAGIKDTSVNSEANRVATKAVREAVGALSGCLVLLLLLFGLVVLLGVLVGRPVLGMHGAHSLQVVLLGIRFLGRGYGLDAMPASCIAIAPRALVLNRLAPRLSRHRRS